MVRKIIKINETLCNGCEACASACHEGAIVMKNGKAVLLREDYCDGLGDCLPACPAGAITFEEREAPAFKKASVKASQNQNKRPNWPLQLCLSPVQSAGFQDADLLIAADCTAFACPDFHQKLAKGKLILIGCPKLDDADYVKKLTEIFSRNSISSVTLARMEVPCCKGLEYAAKTAIIKSGKSLSLEVISLGIGPH